MAEIFDPLTYGGLAQKAIDKLIDYWFTGLKGIFGDDAEPTDKAPLPFYASGSGYWFTFNDGVVADEGNASYDFCFAEVSWEINNADLKMQYVGVPDIPYPSWSQAVLDYWAMQPVKAVTSIPRFDYIADHDITHYAYYISNTSYPSTIYGIDDSNAEWPEFSQNTWRKYNGNTISETNVLRIFNNAGYPSPSYSAVGTIPKPIEDGRLNLPLSENKYWFFCGDTYGDITVENNFYNSFDSHNTNNQYYDSTTYNDYYNTYNVSVSPDLKFDIGVGPLGVAIGVGGIGGIGGGLLDVNPEISFDDLIDILTPIVTDLNDNDAYGVDFDIQLHDFEYYMQYEDMGDFYIEPLHQYDKLPSAPTFDGTIDLGDYPRVIGASVNTYMDLLPVGISALLSAVFIIAIILDNLRGRR